MYSNTVTAGDDATATQYNNLRKDAIYLGSGDIETTGGSASAYTLALDAQIDGYATGVMIKFIANHTCAGASTINVNSLGAKDIKVKGLDTFYTQIREDDMCIAYYNGTYFELLNPSLNATYTFNFAFAVFSSGRYGAYLDDLDQIGIQHVNTDLIVAYQTIPRLRVESVTDTDIWADAIGLRGVVKLGDYIYTALYTTSPVESRIYRLDFDDLTTNVNMSFASGSELGTTASVTWLSSDGEYLYMNNDGGHESAANKFRKYSISGTTLTQVGSTITVGDAADHVSGSAVDMFGNFYAHSISTDEFKRYNSSGTLQETVTANIGAGIGLTIKGLPYADLYSADSGNYQVIQALLPVLPT